PASRLFPYTTLFRSRRRRSWHPASVRAETVRSRSGVNTTRWSMANTPLGWREAVTVAVAAGPGPEPAVSPSRVAAGSVLVPSRVQDTMPLPGPPARRWATRPTLQTPPSTAKPRPPHTPGASAISRATSSTMARGGSTPAAVGLLAVVRLLLLAHVSLHGSLRHDRPRVAEQTSGLVGPGR